MVEKTKWIQFLVKDVELLRKQNTVWDKVSADTKKEFDSESAYNKEFLKTKIKSNGDEVTDFYDIKIPKVDSNHTRLAVVSLDSVLKKDGNFYSQVFLKQCKCTEEKVIRYVNDNFSGFLTSDESDEEQILAAFLSYY